MEFRTLMKSELEQWFDHCMVVFNHGVYNETFRNRFVNHFYEDPYRDLNTIFVAVDKGEIVSTVRIFKRKIELDGVEVTLGGIGEVSTKESYRGKGLASKLLKMAVEKMETEEMTLSLLGTGVPTFYEQFGWQSIKLFHHTYGIREEFETTPRIREISFPKDLSVLQELYKRHSGAHVREECYWESWVNTESPTGYLLLDEARNGIAYAFVDEREDGLFIKEYGAMDDSLFQEFGSFIGGMFDVKEVIVPNCVATSLVNRKTISKNDWMIRLNHAVETKNHSFQTTEELAKAIKEQHLPFYYWEVDGF